MRTMQVNASLDLVTAGGTAGRTASLCRALTALGVQTSALTLDIGLDTQVLATLGNTEVTALRCLERRFFVTELARHKIWLAVAAADVVHLSGVGPC